MSLKIVKKKCPYCGADTEYKYGSHELKCPMCKQSCIIDYERPSFSDLLKMKEYCLAKLDKELDSVSMYNLWGLDPEQQEMILSANEKTIEKLKKRVQACEDALDEAIDVELR